MQATTQSESSSVEKRPLSKREKKNLAVKTSEEERREIAATNGNQRVKRKKKKQKLESVEREKREGEKLVGGMGMLAMEEKKVKMSGAVFDGYWEKRAIDWG
ncbi:uncharacterized protein EAF01_009229 [Botrytis porri]|uniref:uncharacterized protein n=1 Tax=Botrytis porri TaxID=87229 RepID=UPI0019003556|nr:uncharacterized protein EAF01_009229 [Botrytis porri]KAF7896826.1 hypothetical protein EAF01_009229 [Botrytis porri]